MAKKAVPKATKTKKTLVEDLKESSLSQISLLDRVKKINSRKWLAVGIILVLLLLYLNKGLILAATVNGSPISTLELSQRLHNQYKISVLNQMIDEKIIEQEAKKAGVSVSKAEVEAKLKEMEQAYGGEGIFNSLLSQQGIDREAFLRTNIYLPLLVEKMYKPEIQPTDEEVKKFMAENAQIPEATEPAKFKTLAENSVKQEKLVKVFQEKFQQLKSQAKVQIF